MQCFLPLTKELLENSPQIHIVGNVSFPSGSNSTTIKVAQAIEMVVVGCNEIDMVMNVGLLRSGLENEVAKDIDSRDFSCGWATGKSDHRNCLSK